MDGLALRREAEYQRHELRQGEENLRMSIELVLHRDYPVQDSRKRLILNKVHHIGIAGSIAVLAVSRHHCYSLGEHIGVYKYLEGLDGLLGLDQNLHAHSRLNEGRLEIRIRLPAHRRSSRSIFSALVTSAFPAAVYRNLVPAVHDHVGALFIDGIVNQKGNTVDATGHLGIQGDDVMITRGDIIHHKYRVSLQIAVLAVGIDLDHQRGDGEISRPEGIHSGLVPYKGVLPGNSLLPGDDIGHAHRIV